MALVVKDRVKVTTATTGTGTLTLGSAVTKFQDFSVIGDGNTTYYAIESGNGTDWEVGIGTYTASGTTLSRDTILESSNAGSAINLSGTSTVFCTYPAERSVNTEDIGVTVQAYDADTAKLDVVQTFTAAQTFSTDATINGLTVGKGANAVATNTAFGLDALDSGSLSGTLNTAIGNGALTFNTTGIENTAVGFQAMYDNTTGDYNTVIGSSAMSANTTGNNNTALGYTALFSNTTANNNTAVGYQALFDNTTGARLTALGRLALTNNTTASDNTAIGSVALTTNTTGAQNTALGTAALFSNTTASNNVAVGYQAGYSNTTGSQHTALGYQALVSNTTASYNTALGYQALYDNTTGTENTGVGLAALASVTSGSYNTALGHGSGDTITTGTYNTSLGYQAEPSSATAVGDFTLGDTNVASLRCNDTTISSLSDARDKTDVVDNPYGLDFVNTLQPRQFKWQTRDGNIKDGKTRLGFIAQELLTATDGQNDILDLVMDNNPEKLEAKIGNLVPILTQAIKELSAKVDALQTEINVLKGA